MKDNDLFFSTKGLHFCNCNVQIDEVRLLMASDSGPDICGFCETFMIRSVLDNQVAIDGFDFWKR